MLMTTDTRLVARVIRGDREAFEAVFEATFQGVFAFAAQRRTGRAAAEELTQRILRRTFTALESYRGEVPFAAWLLEIAKQVEREDRRSPARVRARSPFAHTSPR